MITNYFGLQQQVKCFYDMLYSIKKSMIVVEHGALISSSKKIFGKQIYQFIYVLIIFLFTVDQIKVYF